MGFITLKALDSIIYLKSRESDVFIRVVPNIKPSKGDKEINSYSVLEMCNDYITEKTLDVNDIFFSTEIDQRLLNIISNKLSGLEVIDEEDFYYEFDHIMEHLKAK